MSERQAGASNAVKNQEMVLVPRRPTEEMVEAAWAYAHDEDAAGVWSAMIAAWLKQGKLVDR